MPLNTLKLNKKPQEYIISLYMHMPMHWEEFHALHQLQFHSIGILTLCGSADTSYYIDIVGRAGERIYNI